MSLAQALPLSVVGNHGLASWEGGKGAQVLPGEQSCLLQMKSCPETLLLLPSQAPLSACHQNSIPSASPAMFGHSSLSPVKEQLVVAAYVSVCLGFFIFIFKVNVFDCLETFLTLFLSGLV